MSNELTMPPEFTAWLTDWFAINARILPWRENRDPYRVWVSEIMLQQTRVDTAIAYYERFIKRFPDVFSLAASDESALLKHWEGLGYYNRAKNLYQAAKIIAYDYNGIFPADCQAIRSLPGIGDYTAGTICAICFNLPCPSVDGNILRVVTRLTACKADIADSKTKDLISGALEPLYETAADRGAFVQAMMELGALVCLPSGEPKCGDCPVRALCKARALNLTTTIPVKSPAKAKSAEDLTVFVVRSGGSYAVQKRSAGGLLGRLWEFPNIHRHLNESEAIAAVAALGFNDAKLAGQKNAIHIFTHRIWNMRAFCFECKTRIENFEWDAIGTPESTVTLPTAFKKLIL